MQSIDTIPQDFHIKWSRIQAIMQRNNFDACILTIGVNLYYTTGVMFNGYFYLPQQGEPIFFVKRPDAWEDKRVALIRKPEQITEILEKKGMPLPKRILLEGDELTYNEFVRLQSIFNPEETGNATALVRKVRMVKTPLEIEQTRICAAKHAKTYSEIRSCYKPGMTDLDLQYEIEYRMRKNGSLGLFRAFGSNMDIYMGSLLAGDNAEAPSPFDYALGGNGAHPSLPLGANGTELKEGMAVMIDMAGNYTPYMTDMTRVFSIGKLPDIAYHGHNTALEIQKRIETMAMPGMHCSEMYNIALETAKEAGLEAHFMGTKLQAKFVGHGVGLQINELPVLTPRSKDVLEAGMIFALEPKFVFAGIGAVGIENTFLVTETGVEKLTIFPEEIQDLTSTLE
ncbi:MAG: M24 family metallopeptidase [Tannerellaceae bacterium]